MGLFNSKKCNRCEGKLKDSFDFCPYCGLDLRNPEKDMRDFGMLGKNNTLGAPLTGGLGGLGITDRVINSLFNNIMKNLEKQMQNISPEEVENMPNGIKISIGKPVQRQPRRAVRKAITEEQIKRMSKLPRMEAKTNVRRLSDKVVYEIKASGIQSVDDVFVSKLESGYEIKAIGKSKVYVNSIPVNLPIRGFSITEKGLNVEFGLQ